MNKMKKNLVLRKIAALAFGFAFAIFQSVWAEENLPAAENGAEKTASIRVLVTPGSEWKGKFPPQFAVWVQDSEGNFVQTLFATKRASKRSWIFAPKSGRPESLPVWYNASGNEKAFSGGEKLSTELENGLDAVTSATPKGSFDIVKKLRLDETKKYFVFAEVNKSFDYNEFYPKNAEKKSPEYSGVNGQPSAVYCAELSAENPEAKMNLVGTGSLTGKNGSVENKTETLTTAKNLVEKIVVLAGF